MKSSWFGSKAEGAVVVASPRNSLDKPQKRALPTAYSTPHDAILADLHSSPDRVASPEASHTDLNVLSVSTTPSQHPYQPSRLPSPDILLDPFDGTSLGTLVPHSQDPEVQPDHLPPSQINLSSPEVGPSQSVNPAVPPELVWSHLTNILDLQSQISQMHIEMEGIGSGKAADVKSKKHVFSHKATLSNVSTTGVGSGSKRARPDDPSVPPGLNGGFTTAPSSGGEPEGDEENVDVPSEEAEKNKAREEEFASLAHQFEGRKQAISDIMGKVPIYHFPDILFEIIIPQLDDLFNVLTEFNSLQAPSLDLPTSRQSSSAVTPAVNNLSPPVVADNDIKTKMSSTQASTSTRPQPQRASSSSALSPPAISRTQSDSEPVPRKMVKKPLPPILLVNSMDTALEGNTQNSAPSTPGSLRLED